MRAGAARAAACARESPALAPRPAGARARRQVRCRSPLPHLHSGLGLTPPTSAPGPGSPLPHLRRGRTRQYSLLAVTALHCAKGRTLTKERCRGADRCGAAASVQGSGVGRRALSLVALRNRRSRRLCYRTQRVRPARQTWAPALVARTSRLLCFRSRSRRSLELRLLVPHRTFRLQRAPHRRPELPARRTYHPSARKKARHWAGSLPPTSTTSAPGPGSPLPHLRRDQAHPSHICAGAGPANIRCWL